MKIFFCVVGFIGKLIAGVSLCLNEYADHVKLGVMCDSQLAPHHPILARGFPEHVNELARSCGALSNQ
jgi:hypothetical protein